MSTQAFAAALAAILESGVNDALQPLQLILDDVRLGLERVTARAESIDAELVELRRKLEEGIYTAHVDGQMDKALEGLRDQVKEIAKEVAEEAASEAVAAHEGQYDHDDYDIHINDEEKHPDTDYLSDNIRDEVRELMRNATLSVSL